MAKYIMLTSIRTAPIHSSNNDASGAPKSFLVGGVPRNIQSSASRTRNMRTEAHNQFPDFFGGIRSKDHTEDIKASLIAQGCKRDLVDSLSAEINQLITGKKVKTETEATNITTPEKPKKGKEKPAPVDAENDEDDGEEKTSGTTLALISRGQIDDIVAHVKKDLKWSVSHASAQKTIGATLAASNPKDILDMHCWGNLFASLSIKVEGAVYASYAYSTHRVDNEIDFFTAIDDNSAGSSTNNHLGTRELASATLASTTCINLDLLRSNLAKSNYTEAEFLTVVEGLINLIIRYDFATGRHSKMLTNTIPEHVEIGCYRGSYSAMSFETPVERGKNGGYLDASIEHAKAEMKRLLTFAIDKPFSVVAVDKTGLKPDAIKQVMKYVR